MGESLATGTGEPKEASTAPAQEPQQEPDGKQQAAESWTDSLPEDLKSQETLTKFKSQEDLARGYIEAEKLAHGKFPDAKSSKEEWDRFYRAMGRPETPDDYVIEQPETLPAGVDWDEEAVTEFKKIAHEEGLTPKTVARLNEFNLKLAGKAASANYWTPERGLAELEVRFPNEKQRDQYLEAVHRGIKSYASPDMQKMLDKTGMGNNPMVLDHFHKLGLTVKEDTQPTGGEGGGPGVSRQEALAEIARIKQDLKHPYHQGNPAAVKQMELLYRAAYGTKVILEVQD